MQLRLKTKFTLTTTLVVLAVVALSSTIYVVNLTRDRFANAERQGRETAQRIFQQAQLNQSTSLANMQARLQAMGMNDQAALGYMAQLLGLSTAEMQARMQADQLRAAQRGGGHLGDVLGGAGSFLTGLGVL